MARRNETIPCAGRFFAGGNNRMRGYRKARGAIIAIIAIVAIIAKHKNIKGNKYVLQNS